MNHVKRGDMTHTRDTLFKIVCLILGTERCGEIGRIDMSPDVHVEVSHVMCTGVTPS
jgi:hypothetical protein